jgi:hypothetical protein
LFSRVADAFDTHVTKPASKAMGRAKFAMTANPSALKDEESDDSDQVGLIAAEALQRDAAAGGGLATRFAADRSLGEKAAAKLTPAPVDAARVDRQLAGVKAGATEAGALPEGSSDRAAFNQLKGTNKAQGLMSLAAKPVEKGVKAGVTLATGGLSLAADQAVDLAVGKGVDKAKDAAVDKWADRHDVAAGQSADLFAGDLGAATARAMHTNRREGDLHADLAAVAPGAAADLALTAAKGHSADGMKAMRRAAKYVTSEAEAEAEEASRHQAVLDTFDPYAK